MRVLTMNIFNLDGGWPDRRRVLVDGLRELAPDVVAFQEAVWTGDYDQVVDVLGSVLGSGYHVFHQQGRSGDGVGAAIASRWPFEVIEEADLHVGSGGDPTGWIGSLAVARIDAPAPGGPVLLAHHKPTWQSGMEHVREQQAVAAARSIEGWAARTGLEVIVVGDFDAAPDAASIRFWTGRQSLDATSVHYQDAWEAVHGDDPGHTFTPRNGLVSPAWRPRPGRRIDYVLVRCGAKGAGLDVTACDLAFDSPVDGVWASDHFGVVADLIHQPPADAPHG